MKSKIVYLESRPQDGGYRRITGRLGERELAAWVFAALMIFVVYVTPSSMLVTLLPGLLILCTVMVVFVTVYYLRVPYLLIPLFLFVAAFQDFFVLALNPASEGRSIPGYALLVGYTTVLAGAILAVWLLHVRRVVTRRLFPIHIVTLLFLAWVGISFVWSGAPMAARIPALRNATAFLLLFYVGLFLPRLDRRGMRRILGYFGTLAVVVISLGYLEVLALGDRFWTEILGIDRLIEAKNLSVTSRAAEPVPVDFYTPLAGASLRRMPSVFATPITMGYFVAFTTFLCIYWTRVARGFSFPLSVLGCAVVASTLALTFVKGAYQIVAVGLLAILICWFGGRRNLRFRAILGFWIVSAAVALWIGFLLFPGTTVAMHLHGLLGPLLYLDGAELLLGQGLGSGGTISVRLGADVVVAARVGAESGIGALLMQVGLFGVLLYFAFMVLVIRALYREYVIAGETNQRWLLLCVAGALFGLFANAFLQENAFAPVPIAGFFIFAGLTLNLTLRSADGPLSDPPDTSHQHVARASGLPFGPGTEVR